MAFGIKERFKDADKPKPTRWYSSKQEKAVAKKLGGKTTPNSGATMFQPGDVQLENMLVECKTKMSHSDSISIKKDWLEKITQEAVFMGKPYSALVFNFGPDEESVLTVSEVAQKVCECYGSGEVVVRKKDDLHEANLLMLNIEKAKNILGWIPTYNADVAIQKTVEWYKHFYKNDVDMYDFTMSQIEDYEDSIKWVN